MDLNTVLTITPARSREDLRALSPRVAPLAGGSDLFADPQVHLTGLVDLQTLRWPALTVTGSVADAAADAVADGVADGVADAVTDAVTGTDPGDPGGVSGLEIAATCTLAELSRLPAVPGWAAHPLLFQCCTALYGSFKIWNVATVGGNLCASLPAGPMTTLAAALEAEVLIWRADGSDERMPAAAFVTGNTTNVLGTGDVLRSIHVPASSLASRTVYRKIALSPLGRSGAVLVGRLDPAGGFVLTVTAGTVRPVQLRYPSLPAASALARDIAAIDYWFTDAHGAADWRRAVSGVLGEEIRAELEGAALENGEHP
ncbi:FAD-binding molybdopterin dehydrogenase [Cryobacterium sp. TmT2-59]|uniref:FAD binding domain-containing protein n=1 Tax=Cryobacterium sp. TmT2-59 TaxID=1259264 RepID=UPI00106B55D7|nr:FAD binding domain-containing protein [Cryobacterium sp. TmT2-59]TFC84678.1 FAD-binding molybdopterin dehydrogenase [Cryobacterium sp. TmT2-59]